MNKAFVFDMDGVLVDSEVGWSAPDSQILITLFGKDIAQKIGSTVGNSIKMTYEKALSHGGEVSYAEFVRAYDDAAKNVYARSPLTEGLDLLADKLLSLDYKMAIVSSSSHTWIDCVVPRLSFAQHLDQIISVWDHPVLRPKPHPDGYIEALRKMSVEPKNAMILEDSNAGIRAAKAAGVYTIGFRGNLVPGYQQSGADTYADTITDVVDLVEEFDLGLLDRN